MGYSQDDITGTIIYSEDNLPLPGVDIILMQDGVGIKETQTDIDGNFKITGVAPGTYDLKIKFLLVEELITSIAVAEDNHLNNIIFPKPCVKNSGICPHNHRNNIVPIQYGLPSVKMTKKATKGKIKLGGCIPSCEIWHCKTHNLDF
jgi:hypothetical protein